MQRSLAFLFYIFALATVAEAYACQRPVGQPLQFASLWDNGTNIENLNQIEKLCQGENYSAACLEKALTPSISVYPLYAEANTDTPPFGAFLARFAAGEGGKLAYVDLSGGYVSNFDPDMFDPDWGYGPPYFHQTFINKKDNWYEFALPLPVNNRTTGWAQLEGEPHILTFKKGDVVIFNSRTYAIVDITAEGVTLRDEQPADMWCEVGDPPALEAFTPIVVPLEKLYTSSCQLRLHVAYTRGC